MERSQFNTLLINSTALTDAEASELIHLSTKFPYSQVIHNLAARGAADCSLPLKEKLLQTSAIYSTDRSALKTVMTAPKRKRIEPKTTEVEVKILAPSEPTDADQLHEQILQDIASLQESKRLYELTIERLEKEKALPLPDTKETPAPAKSKESDSLIEEIKSTKKKIKPEGVKQKEQIEIIDQFIKTQPSIPRPKSAGTPGDSDLAEPSAQFGENIVSETLVEILLKQGKKEKAIEALKKLIWKFPQKKAYFAAQIEDLRK
ncbi:MAG TPA: hypothetical protein VKQ08_03520 [Cyclobacteriaceae bacterium]|nr:hypothetical protein [Cyclobacteriaceae bacterium]